MRDSVLAQSGVDNNEGVMMRKGLGHSIEIDINEGVMRLCHSIEVDNNEGAIMTKSLYLVGTLKCFSEFFRFERFAIGG